MKKYKNISWALGSYIVGLIIYFTLLYVPGSSPSAVYTPALVLILIGVFFGFRSIKAKESTWAGHLLVIVGGLLLASPIILLVLGANGFL